MPVVQRKPTDQPTLAFWGAASEIGGSQHLFSSGTKKILLECGLYQGKREESRHRNSHFPFDPAELAACIVSHAHIDHCGNLPTLVRQGFQGPIFVTPATFDLLPIMLKDSAKIQEEDAAHLNIARNYAEPFIQPLYTLADVDRALQQVQAIPYGKRVELPGNCQFRFHEAGHILGSAFVALESAGKRLTYSGDIGRRENYLLQPAEAIPPADLVVCESTYGDRVHPSIHQTVNELYEIIRTTIKRGGRVLIPAFSLGRIQLIIHFLQLGVRSEKFPSVPIYIDSPLSAEVAEVYRNHTQCLLPEVAEAVRRGVGLLGGEGIHYVRDYQESNRIVTLSGPSIVIASSGMCDAGRIQNYLKHSIDDPRASVILVSYQAEGTTGRRLLAAEPTIRFAGKDWNKWINVYHLDGFSGHADKDDFVFYFQPLLNKVKKIRLIHGSVDQALALAETLRTMGFPDVDVPRAGEEVLL